MCGFEKSARCDGRIRRASNNDAKSAIETTLGNTFRNLPIIPSIIRSGIKAATVVKTAAITGHMTSEAPLTAASFGSIPSSMFLWTFSITTIASSTTIPSTRTSAKRLRLFIVIPKYCMSQKVIMNENGIPIAANIAFLQPMKTRSVRNTRMIPSTAEDDSVLMLLFTVFESSFTTLASTLSYLSGTVAI